MGSRKISVCKSGSLWVVREGGRVVMRFSGPAARQAAEQYADNLEISRQVQASFDKNRDKILSFLKGGRDGEKAFD